MNEKKKSWTFRLLSGALGLLGFASCGNDDDDDVEIWLEYGTPTTQFRVKGTVTSEEGDPLKGIQVVVRKGWDNQPEYGADTLYTDEKGDFLSDDLLVGSVDKQKVYFNDVDGEENGGEFEPDSIALEDMDETQVEAGSGWYNGKFEYSPKGPVKLSKKEKE